MKKIYYSISEVCNLLDLKPHIVRYWEIEFPILKTSRTKGSTRRYTNDNIEILKKIRDMLYVQKYTIKGVKNKLAKMKSAEIYNNEIDKGIINDELKSLLIKELTDIKNALVKINS